MRSLAQPVCVLPRFDLLLRGLTLALALALALPSLAAAESSKDAGSAADADNDGGVRAQFMEGEVLSYQLKLDGASRWSPQKYGNTWVAGRTDFTFDLVTKTVRPNDSATFVFKGKQLNAVGESNAGKIGIEADQRKARLLTDQGWTRYGKRSPLTNRRESTITLNDRFQVRDATGMGWAMPYLLPGVDRTFWYVLTAAPRRTLVEGDEWEQKFNWPIPSVTDGKPLEVQAKFEVGKQRVYGGQPVLPITITAKLELQDTEAVMRNGDRVTIDKAVYLASGTAYWHASRGILCYATAKESFKGQSKDTPRQTLEHEARSTLELKATK